MRIALVILIALLQLTPAAVAAKCKGEFSAAIVPCACSVKNRIDAGWSPGKVLSAYYARPVPASDTEVNVVADVMSGAVECDPNLYFMYSSQDTIVLGIQDRQAVLVVSDGDDEVRFYERWFRR